MTQSQYRKQQKATDKAFKKFIKSAYKLTTELERIHDDAQRNLDALRGLKG